MEVDRCFAPVRFGIAEDARIKQAREFNSTEASEIDARRKKYLVDTAVGTDAVGLALSGGGIRSATFCLGVVQVLAERGLMEQVDYLSTVSGGGYTGTLITSWIGRGKQFTDLGRPHGADPGPVRHVRQHAKYLSAADLKQRWLMLIETMAGMLLNWTAPFCAIAVLALIAYWAGPAFSHELRVSAIVLAALTVVLTLLYGIALRIAPHTRIAVGALAASAGLTVLATAALLVDMGYPPFLYAVHQPWSVMATAATIGTALPAAIRFLPTFRSPRATRIAFETSSPLPRASRCPCSRLPASTFSASWPAGAYLCPCRSTGPTALGSS